MTPYFKKCTKIAPRYILPCLIFIFILLPFSTSHGATVILSWDANPEPDIDGYKIYYGTSSGDYDYVIDAGNVTNYELDLSPRKYYLAMIAYDTSNNESGYSEEVIFGIEASTTWYFPYGYNKASKRRYTYLFLQNPNDEEAYVTVTYMLKTDPPSTEVREHVVEPESVYRICTHDDVAYPGVVFGMGIESDLPIVAERRLRWGSEHNWMVGVSSAQNTWYFPYGYNKASKRRYTYLFLQNPNDEEAYVTITYMLRTGSTEVREHVVEPKSVYRIRTHDDVAYPGVVFGMGIESDLPIVTERRLRWGSEHNWMVGAVIPK